MQKFTYTKLRRHLWCMIVIIFWCNVVYSQNSTLTVSGKVYDENGDTLPGVNILQQGTTNGTVTDFDGNYSLQVPDGSILIISFVGYVTEEVEINGRTKIDVTLTPDILSLSEIVVIGYGETRKRDVTGAVASVKAEDLNQGATLSVQQALQGRTAGVQIYQNSSAPGGGMSVQIRGVSSITGGNEPLYVIDGFPIDNGQVIAGTGAGFTGTRTGQNPLNALNPSDIESIEVLKDASASAIYGSRAANGVILITTKSGRNQTDRLRVQYDGYYGVQEVAEELDLLTATEYQSVMNELIAAGAVGEPVNEIQGNGTDWQNEIFRVAPIQNHNVSMTGSSGKTSFYTSFGYFGQEGVVESSGLDRYTARLNLNHNMNDKFKLALNFNTSYLEEDIIPNGVVSNEGAGVISAAIDYDPTLSVFDDEGNYQVSDIIQKDNPLAIAFGKEAISQTFRTFGTISLEYFITPELSIKTNLGGDINAAQRKVFVSSLALEGRENGGIASRINGLRYNYLGEYLINYRKTFNDRHDFTIVGGATFQKFFIDRHNSSSENFVVEAVESNDLGAGDQSQFQVGSSSARNQLESYLGRVNYSLDEKYILTASIRADGSSRFGENNRFGFFPSAAFAWHLGDENFIRNIEFINSLKLRLGWGQIGNQSIPNGSSQATFSADGRPMIFEDNQLIGSSPNRAPNPDLKWETTEQFNVGLDFHILKSRISGTIEYFIKNTDDLLLNNPIPSQTGFQTRLENVGSVRNSGLEFLLSARIVDQGLVWDADFNAATLKNEVISLGPGIDEIIQGGVQFNNNMSIITPGEPINSYYGYEVLGVWQEDDDFSVADPRVVPGDIKIRDINGDTLINSEDRVILGNSIPRFTWGLNNRVSFKGFNLNIAVQGVHDVKLINQQLVQTYYPLNLRRNKFAEPYLNRWTPENPTNEYPSFVSPGNMAGTEVNSRTVLDASFIRIQNVTLGYKFPKKWIPFASSVEVYMAVNNLLTITDYEGYDPGANNNGTNNAALRIDFNAYPLARTYLAGLRIGF